MEIDDKHYLGTLCLRNHEYENTGLTLRRKGSKSCVECCRELDRQGYEANKEERKRLMRERYYMNKEKRLEYAQKYYEENKEKIAEKAHSEHGRAVRKAQYERNREKYLAQQSEYAKAHREERNAYQRAHYAKNKEKIKAAIKERYHRNKALRQQEQEQKDDL